MLGFSRGRGIDVAVLGFDNAGVERRRHFVGSLHSDCGGSCACRSLSVVLRHGGLREPTLRADHAPVAAHILNKEHIVGIVQISGSSGGFLAHGRVNGGQLVELGLAREFTLRVGGELRLVGENVDVAPLLVSGKLEVASNTAPMQRLPSASRLSVGHFTIADLAI